MRIAQIEEEGKPVYEAQLEDFDLGNEKVSFDASQFNKGKNKLSVPAGLFLLSLDGKNHRCRMLVATHFIIIRGTGGVWNSPPF